MTEPMPGGGAEAPTLTPAERGALADRYPYFPQLLARIVATPGHEDAAGEPSADWQPYGPGYVVACQLIAGADVWYPTEQGPRATFEDLRYLLVELNSGIPTFSLHPALANATEWVGEHHFCNYPCEKCEDGEVQVLELIDLARNRSLRPEQLVVTRWIESQCVLDGSVGQDPNDHDSHSHREVVR
jgi:hypothetical protein